MRNQRGEGKFGCVVSLLVFGAMGAIGYKAVPVYFSNNELVDACEFIASAASKKPMETVEREVKDKATELGIVEAGGKGAIRVTKVSNGDSGTCTITLHYKRTIDFYGVYRWDLETDKRISRPIFENAS